MKVYAVTAEDLHTTAPEAQCLNKHCQMTSYSAPPHRITTPYPHVPHSAPLPLAYELSSGFLMGLLWINQGSLILA